jgi:pyrroloquinoline quinone biosynthesis protein B
MLRLRVLGSGAGGGFPQWNCGCENCRAVRAGDPAFEPRTQDSIAASADGTAWVLLNASPDVLRQIQAQSILWPREARHSPISAIVLTNGDLDHVLGLFSLRESQPFALYATQRVWDGLQQNLMMRTLSRFSGQVVFRPLRLGEATPIEGPDGKVTGVLVEPFAAPGKPPVHLVSAFAPDPEDNVGLLVRDAGKACAAYATAARTASFLPEVVRGADALLFDGTFWSQDELVARGLGTARAADMAHVPMDGEQGSLEVLQAVDVGRRIYTHINNTNPVLRRGSRELQIVESRGWEIATDGMDLVLGGA